MGLQQSTLSMKGQHPSDTTPAEIKESGESPTKPGKCTPLIKLAFPNAWQLKPRQAVSPHTHSPAPFGDMHVDPGTADSQRQTGQGAAVLDAGPVPDARQLGTAAGT